MQPVDKTTMPYKVNARVVLSAKGSGVPTSHNHDKVIKAKVNEPSIEKTAKTNDVPYRTRSGREV